MTLKLHKDLHSPAPAAAENCHPWRNLATTAANSSVFYGKKCALRSERRIRSLARSLLMVTSRSK